MATRSQTTVLFITQKDLQKDVQLKQQQVPCIRMLWESTACMWQCVHWVVLGLG